MPLDLTPSDVTRFWSFVEKTDTCWLWRGNKVEGGYGHFWLHGLSVYAHRVGWTLANGPIPDKKMVLHTCEANYAAGDMTYRACVRSDHLYTGTHADNMRDMVATGRVATGDRNSQHAHPERRARGDTSGSRLHPERLRRGESSPNAKLTENDVRLMRSLYAAGGTTHHALARQFQVSYGLVHFILTRQAWKHVA